MDFAALHFLSFHMYIQWSIFHNKASQKHTKHNDKMKERKGVSIISLW